MRPERARAGRGPGGARLVFEIGTEELPPAAAWDGARQLAEYAGPAFEASRIPVGAIRTYSTPRRLVLVAEGVAPRQQDVVREVRGPAVKVAFDPEGKPTQAAWGFARAQGIPVAALVRRATPQGEYVFAVRRERGAPTARVLAELLPSLVAQVTFPKTMRWGTGSARFARPIRWVLALLGSRVVPCTCAGVRADRYTYGHRLLHPGRVRVPSADAYPALLRRAGVLLDPEERRSRIAAAVTRAAAAAGGRPVLDPDLLEETVQLVEWPAAFAGRFAEEFLALPREVLITVMQHHQKYFAVEDASGRVLPAFVAVRNGGASGLRTVREGNEWVLRARLADARFFFEEDRKRPLAARVGDLEELVFHERLGTMADKTRRLEALARWLSGEVGLGEETSGHLLRAAHLSKADLVTQVVRELPELQGVMGGIYARLDGEPEPVARAIAEQYLPRGEKVPQSDVGAYLALLDKADTLVGALAAGLAPTGSQDPYGLRRASHGIVVLLVGRGVRLRLSALARAVLDAYGITDPARRSEAASAAAEMIRQRLRTALVEEGISYDVAEAVLTSSPDGEGEPADDVADAAARARALWAFRRRPEFARVYTAYDRASRILPRGFDGSLRPEALTHPAERRLHQAVEEVRRRVGPALAARRYEEALLELSGLADPVDRFFADVLVMAEDESVRTTRLALLASVVRLIRPIADLSRVVVEGKAQAASEDSMQGGRPTTHRVGG
jgi:glycyl-tRNA synthetase beta chain